MVIIINLSKNLRYYREQAGYKTAKEFVDVLKIPYNTYTAYENQNREPKLDLLIKMASLLHVSIDDLVGYSKLGKPTNPEDKKLEIELNNLLSECNLSFYEINLKFERISKNKIIFSNITRFTEEKFYFSIPKDKFIQGLEAIDKEFFENKRDLVQMYLYDVNAREEISLLTRDLKNNLSNNHNDDDINKLIDDYLKKIENISQFMFKDDNEENSTLVESHYEKFFPAK